MAPGSAGRGPGLPAREPEELHDLTLHPVDPAQVERRFVDLVHGDVPLAGLPELAARRYAAAGAAFAAALAGRVAGRELTRTLGVALGTLLGESHPYWYERASGLAVLAADVEPGLDLFLRDPAALLAPRLPALPPGALGPSEGVWVPSEAVRPLRALLHREAHAFRGELEGRGEYTYLAALVEATGYCVERGFGLLELAGVCTLDEAPNPRFRRAFFERRDERPGWGVEEEPEVSVAGRRLAKARAVLETDPEWALELAEEALEELPPQDVDAAQAHALRAEALEALGRPEAACEAVEVALAADPDDREVRLARDRVWASAGRDLPRVVARVKTLLRQAAPEHDVDDFSWADDIDRVAELEEPEEVASLMAILGVAYLRLGYPEQGRFVLEQALELSPDEARARRVLRGMGEEE